MSLTTSAVAKSEPWMALEVCEEIVWGLDLASIEQKAGFPSKKEFLRWVMTDPGVAQLFKTAREMSAFSLEEEALQLTRDLVRSPGTAQKVQAVRLLVEQLRWSAARRNPSVYSEKVATQITVPIHITTSLDLGGQAAGGGTAEYPNIYDMSALNVEEKPLTELTDADLDALSPATPGDEAARPRNAAGAGPTGPNQEESPAPAHAEAPKRRRPRKAKAVEAPRANGSGEESQDAGQLPQADGEEGLG